MRIEKEKKKKNEECQIMAGKEIHLGTQSESQRRSQLVICHRCPRFRFFPPELRQCPNVNARVTDVSVASSVEPAMSLLSDTFGRGQIPFSRETMR